jgi:RNA polymerase sigma factor (TIGR02999 family)
VYLRLVGETNQTWKSRGHFFAVAAEAMRRILIDNARRKDSVKRGGGQRRVDLDEVVLVDETGLLADDLIALDEGLERLARTDQVVADLVKLRYFAGLTCAQAAQALGISHNTAQAYWTYARAYLRLAVRNETRE